MALCASVTFVWSGVGFAVAEFFGLAEEEAENALRQVSEATSAWREVATANGLSRQSIEAMEPAFEHAKVAVARELTGV